MNAKAYTYDVFISYTATDQEWVRRELLPHLAAAGLRYALSDQLGAVTPARLLDAEDRIRPSRRLIDRQHRPWHLQHACARCPLQVEHKTYAVLD